MSLVQWPLGNRVARKPKTRTTRRASPAPAKGCAGRERHRRARGAPGDSNIEAIDLPERAFVARSSSNNPDCAGAGGPVAVLSYIISRRTKDNDLLPPTRLYGPPWLTIRSAKRWRPSENVSRAKVAESVIGAATRPATSAPRFWPITVRKCL